MPRSKWRTGKSLRAMSTDLTSFYVDLMQEVAASATANGCFKRTTLVETLANRLIEAEELQDWVPCFYEGRGFRNRNLGLDGYSIDELQIDGTLQVLVAEYREEADYEVLGTADIRAAFGRASAFVEDAKAGRLHDELEPSTPAADLARLIYDSRSAVRTLRIHVLSNATLGKGYRDVERSSVDSMKAELHVWDLVRFHRLASLGGREEIDIDITEFAPGGLPALPAGIGETEYAAYLCVVPGTLLAKIYERFGSRILEGNVRAFLSARGNVNKGIRKTIRTEPGRFFAFNNGITATATKVDRGPGGNIVRMLDLQIVNGGQTTASLYNTREQDGASLDHIFVQMKLSVLPPDIAEVLIPEISRYANTQNKVSEADLFANHPFNRKVEELSRQSWAPGRTAGQMTHWFYERARAQYQTEQIKLTAAQKRTFLSQNPKDQVITKTDLAKFENTWRQLPHIVSEGAQKNFVKYAEAISVEYEERPAEFNERWFQHIVSKAILFKATEHLVSGASWYSGGYRANIVTYAIARLNRLVDEMYPEHVLNLDTMWREQRVPEAVVTQLQATARAAYEVLLSPPAGMKNVTEWAKRARCWDAVAATPVRVVPGLAQALKAIDADREDQRRARKNASDDEVINATIEVVRLSEAGFWARALASKEAGRVLSITERGILETAVKRGAQWVPTDPQAKRLMAAARKLMDEGVQ